MSRAADVGVQLGEPHLNKVVKRIHILRPWFPTLFISERLGSLVSSVYIEISTRVGEVSSALATSISLSPLPNREDLEGQRRGLTSSEQTVTDIRKSIVAARSANCLGADEISSRLMISRN